MITINHFAGMTGTAIKLISSPNQLLQIVAPIKPLYPLIEAPGIKPILQIESPLKTLLPLIEAPNQLLISEPEYNVSVFLTEYDKGLRCLILNIINPGLLTHKELLEGIFNVVTTNETFINFGTCKSIIISAVMYRDVNKSEKILK